MLLASSMLKQSPKLLQEDSSLLAEVVLSQHCFPRQMIIAMTERTEKMERRIRLFPVVINGVRKKSSVHTHEIFSFASLVENNSKNHTFVPPSDDGKKVPPVTDTYRVGPNT